MKTHPPEAVHETLLPDLKLLGRGKVRDIYDLGDQLLIVATDRLSAFDYVLPNPIPDKGKVLNQISAFWFERTKSIVPNHVVSTEVARFPGYLRQHADVLSGRTTLAQKLHMLPVECVARGYLAGSGWKEYRERGTVCGIPLPRGLVESDRLEEPIFTPATKATSGHDENIPFAEVEHLLGTERAAEVKEKTLEIYRVASEYARTRGVLIADTKLEFGLDSSGRLVVADEMLTPDSSRFWPADGYEPGRGQPSFDKQFVRDYLETTGWDKSPPVPPLPPDIVAGATKRYREIFRILTGQELA